MKNKKRIFIVIGAVLVGAISIFLICKRAHFRGEIFVIGNEEYEESAGVYQVNRNVIVGISLFDGMVAYGIEGDPDHNYVLVSNNGLSNWLYVKRDYRKDRSNVEAICFNDDVDNYIYEKTVIELVDELLKSKENIAIDSDRLGIMLGGGIHISLKYKNDSVGEGCGTIIHDGENYLFVNATKKNVTRVSREWIEKMAEFSELFQRACKRYSSV